MTKNRVLLNRYCDQLWNAGDLSLIPELIDEDIYFRGSLGLEVNKIDGFKSYMQTAKSAFPDFNHHLEEVIEEGDNFAVRLTFSGTHKGFLFDIAPTGKRISYAALGIFKLKDSKMHNIFILADLEDVKRKLS